ncbi:MAG: gliding motility lipoprotein GldD [Pedobacter sp.]|nr:MAG: gliding motility lipoprotein GldD [Pedobacter sp.]
MIFKKYILLGLLWCLLGACIHDSHQEGKALERDTIKLPAKIYQKSNFTNKAPYTFEYPIYAKISDDDIAGQSYWNNLDFPDFSARLHLTYYEFKNPKQIMGLTEEARKLAMKHTIRASSIRPEKIEFVERHVFGLYYFIEGDAASSVQFFLTDSVQHYFRGALYFNNAANYDSIKPIIKFLDKDIRHLVNTFEWKPKANLP